MRFSLLFVACLLQCLSACTKKSTAPSAPASSPTPVQAPMDANHRPGILVPDPVTGEVRTPYQPTDKERIKLAALETDLGKLEIAKKDLGKARKLFQTHCASCHGAEGRSGGPLTDTLDVAPTNFHEWPIKYGHRPIELALSINEGRNNAVMPAFGGTLSSDELWSVVALVSSWIEARPDAGKL